MWIELARRPRPDVGQAAEGGLDGFTQGRADRARHPLAGYSLKSEPEPEPDTMRFVEHLPTVLSCCGLSR